MHRWISRVSNVGDDYVVKQKYRRCIGIRISIIGNVECWGAQSVEDRDGRDCGSREEGWKVKRMKVGETGTSTRWAADQRSGSEYKYRWNLEVDTDVQTRLYS
jgi:hypothetical protein